jgi:hypothetical protein
MGAIMIRYAIARPELAGFARIVALLASDSLPETLSPFIAVRLRGYYSAALGELVAYGTYQASDGRFTCHEVMVDTNGT